MSCLSDIFLALLLALLLGRAVRVEVVELAAGEHLVGLAWSAEAGG